MSKSTLEISDDPQTCDADGKSLARIAPHSSLSLKHSRIFVRGMGRLALFIPLVLAILPPPALAQSGSAAKESKGAPILLLGTNEGPPTRIDRSEPSSLLIVDGREYLTDCGIGTIRRMARAGIRSGDIRTIFFTHLHPDHALGLADLMANDFFTLGFAGSVPTVNINEPPETSAFVRAALNYVGIPYGIFQTEGLPWTVQTARFVAPEFSRNGVVYQDDKIRVIPRKTLTTLLSLQNSAPG